MGGTFMSLPTDYRDYFVRNLHDALSGHTSKDVAEAVRQAPTRRAPRPGGGLPGAAASLVHTKPLPCLPAYSCCGRPHGASQSYSAGSLAWL